MSPSYTVLVSLDHGRTFAVREGEPVKASTGQAAAEKVRRDDPALRENEEAQFLPIAKFAPIRKRLQMVEAWRWGPADAGEQPTEELKLDG
jgi:hypothetical protein